MGYEHIVAARNRLAEIHAHLGKHLPQHLWGGGLGKIADAVSSAAPEQLQNFGGGDAPRGPGTMFDSLTKGALGNAGRDISNYFKDRLPKGGLLGGGGGALGGGGSGFQPNMPTNTFNPNMPTNTFNPNMPTNTFHANDPRINEVNYSPAINNLMAQGPGVNDAANAAGQSGLAGALANRGSAAYGQQQNLIGQLQNEAGGQGPGSSLAQALMKQQTENNIKQGAGLIASTKGLNPALAARMAADQSAQMNQNAAAQGANLGFQQQLAARGQLGSILGGQENLYTGTGAGLYNTGRGQDIESGLGMGGLQNQRLGTLVSGNTGQDQVLTQGQLGATGINAGVAAGNQHAGELGEQLRAGVAAGNQHAGELGQELSAGVAAGNQRTAAQGEQLKTTLAVGKMKNQAGITGGLINAGGGVLPKLLGGGGAAASLPGGSDVLQGEDGSAVSGDASSIGDIASTAAHGGQITDYGVIDADYDDVPNRPAPIAGGYAHGGQVDHQALSLAQALMAMGGPVPGKSPFPGDNKKNDIVPTVLSPGEIVLPRTVAQSPDAPAKAASFVEAVRAKAHPTYGKVLQARRMHEQALAAFHAAGGYV